MMPELQTIMERLVKVEKENRRLKRTGLAVLLIVGVGLLMGQALPKGKIEGSGFILKDTAGNVRAELGISGDGSHLWLYGANPKNIGVSIVSGGVGPANGGSLSLSGGDGSIRALLHATGDGAVLNLFGTDAESRAHLGIGTFDFRRPGAGVTASPWLVIYSGVPEPSLEIRDKEGYSVVTGSASLLTPETGESHRTSAASLALFGKDGKLLWSAP